MSQTKKNTPSLKGAPANKSQSKKADGTKSDSFLKKYSLHLVLFLFAFLLYSNTLKHDYALDDSVAIIDNSFTKHGIQGIPDLLKKDFFEGIYGQALEIGGGRWRPLSLITFAIEYQFLGPNPHFSHLINVILYGITAIVLFITLQRVLPKKTLLSFLATILFISLPVHTEVVANIKSRDEILSFLGLCLTILWMFKYLEKGNIKFIVYSCIAYFLSLMSKENGITFIAIIPLMLFCFANKSWKESITKAIPIFIVALVYVLIRWKLVGITGKADTPDVMENPFAGASFNEKYATIIKILGKYLLLLFFPLTLSSDYSFNEIPRAGWIDSGVIVSFLAYTSLFVFAILNIFKSKTWNQIIAFCILFFMISMSLVSNIVFNLGAPMGERFLYMPSLGFCIAVALLLLNVFKVTDWERLNFSKAFIPFVIIIILFSARTIARNADWKDNRTLFGADVKNAPNSAKIHYYYGNSYLNPFVGKPDSPEKTEALKIAIRENKISVEINPKFHHAYYNIGLAYMEMQNADSALFFLNKVLELQPGHIFSQNALGKVYGKLEGDYDKAIEHLSLAIKYNPQDETALEDIGIAYAMKGNYAESIKAFTEALKYKTNDARLYLNTALTYQNLHDTVNANICFNKAFELDPSLNVQKRK